MPDIYEEEPVYPCSNCGRNFIESSLVKHEAACQKILKLHRKVFDSGKQRATGSDIPLTDIRKAQKEKNKVHGGVFPRPQTHWRERHEEFISSVSASKNVKEALKTGAPLPPPPRTSVPSDYVQCEYCCRNFNGRAADRHIAFCKEQHSRKPMGGGGGGANASRSSSTSRASSSSSKFNRTTSVLHGTPLSNNQRHGSFKYQTHASSPTHNNSKAAPPISSPISSSTTATSRANRPPSRFSSRDRSTPAPARSTQAYETMIIGGALIDARNEHRLAGRKPISSLQASSQQYPAISTRKISPVPKNERSGSHSRLKTPKQVSATRR